MMRSLWTSAAGMAAQQLSIDNISNNICMDFINYNLSVLHIDFLIKM